MIDPRESKLPSVLIICPLRKQIQHLEKALTLKGYRNIDASQKHAEDIVLGGANLIMDDSKCNLGWRILFKDLCTKEDRAVRYAEILNESASSEDNFLNLLTVEERRPIKRVTAILRKIRNGRDITNGELAIATDFLNYNQEEILLDKMRGALDYSRISKNIFRDIPIKIVTILGSKGLTKDISFLVNFDDRYLLEREERLFIPSDSSICKFLVSLTRAKIKTYVFTSQNSYPTYIDWIGSDYLQAI